MPGAKNDISLPAGDPTQAVPCASPLELAKEPDLRLIPVAVGVWCAAIIALYLPALIGGVLAAMSLPVIWWFRRKKSKLAIFISVLAIGCFAGFAVTSFQVAVRDSIASTDLVQHTSTATVTATLTDDPRRLPNQRDTMYLIPVTIHELKAKDRSIKTSVEGIIFASQHTKNWAKLLPGQSIKAQGRISPPRDEPKLTAIILSSQGMPSKQGEPPWWQTVAGDLRSGLRQACAPLPAEPAGLIPGLVLGDVSGLDGQLAQDFQDTGMTHLVAVSGSNLVIVTGAVVLLANACGAGRRVKVVLGIAAICGFVVLVRPSPSVLRAAVMSGIGLLMLLSRRRGSAIAVLSATVIALILFDPGLSCDLGFALSVLATGGLVMLANRWATAWQRRGWPAWLALAIAVPLAAQVAVTPVLGAATGSVSLVAVPANVLVAAAVPPATILGVLATLAAIFWPPAAEFLVWLAAWPARWLIFVAHHGADVPAGSIPWPSGWLAGLILAAILAAGLIALRWRLGRRVLLVVALGVVVGVVPVRIINGGWPSPGWAMVACDVGQGDALVLATQQPHTAIVVDAGPEPGLVDSCLKDLGIERVSMLVISHFHADHIGGVAGVYRGRTVDSVLSPAVTDPESGHKRLTEAAKSGSVTEARARSTYNILGVKLDVIAAGEGFSGTASDPNNDSLVVRATVAGVSILLSGDVEEPAQEALLNSGTPIDSDVLKVPHHGSRAFEPEFYEAVSPTVAVISVGAQNDYGHPHPRSINQLRAQGTRVMRTDHDGTVAVIAQDDGLAVSADHRDPSHDQ